MAKVTLWPSGQVLEMNGGQDNLLEGLKKCGVYIKSSCGGHATCGDCVVKVQTGIENLTPQEFAELKLLGNVFHITKERLSCQTKVLGDCTIDISGHEKGEDLNRLLKKTTDMHQANKKAAAQKSGQSLLKKGGAKIPEANPYNVERASFDKGQDFRGDRGAGPRDRKPENDNWYKHWEKKEGEQTPELPGQKRLDGGKRPKFFKPHQEEESEEASKESGESEGISKSNPKKPN